MASIRHSTRRDFLKIAAAAVSLAALAPRHAFSAEPATAAEPLRLSPGVQLFIDDYLIAEQRGLRRVIAAPTRRAAPILTSADDGTYQPYVSVLRDPGSGRFRLWYNVIPPGQDTHIGYMESPDGVNWIRPHRVLENASPVNYGAYVVDEGPDYAKAEQRYKMVWYKQGVCTTTSADGVKWVSTGPQPVVPGIGDIVSFSRDPYRNRYLVICKVRSKPEDGFVGRTRNAKEGTRRLVGQTVSDDFVHWSQPKRIVVPDAKDEGITEYYSIGNVIARGGLLVGPLKVLRDDLPAEPGGDVQGIGYTVLAWTRDGEHWERDRAPFMDRNPQPGTWDRAMTWADCFLPVDDEVFIYYGGYARGHKVEKDKERQIGFAKMQRDRFVSRDATADGGTLRTPPVLMAGGRMTVNADVKGELRVRVLDQSGAAVAGFDAADCAPVQGDSLTHQINYKQSLAALQNKPVQLEFVLKDARLFGFESVA